MMDRIARQQGNTGGAQVYKPVSKERWLELYGGKLPAGYIIVPCAPVLGCKDNICRGWKVVRDGK